MTLKSDADYIVNKSIEAVLPNEAIIKALRDKKFEKDVYLVSVGKAAWSMAKAASDILDIKQGIVITKYGHVKGDIDNVDCYEAGHPVPDENSFSATQKAIDLVSDLGEDDTVVFLLSGGGSALFEKPIVSGGELQNITNKLLASGADITEINTIRKRLSMVKGGKFAKICSPAKVFTIVLSDIIGNPLDMIASGPTCPDSTTNEEATAIAKKYDIEIPDVDTVASLDNAETVVTGSVTDLCNAAFIAAKELGYSPLILTDCLSCEARDAGYFLGAIAKTYANSDKNLAFIAGGETVVHLQGDGRGGRNQEIALAAAKDISELDNVCVFSFGSDGTDGPTDAAGGYVDGKTYESLDCEAALANNDSYNALKKTNGLIITGPTGTNVNDASLILIKHD